MFYFAKKKSKLKTIPNSRCQCVTFGDAGIDAFSRGNVTWKCFQELYGLRFVPFKQHFLSLPARDYLDCKRGLSTVCMCVWGWSIDVKGHF